MNVFYQHKHLIFLLLIVLLLIQTAVTYEFQRLDGQCVHNQRLEMVKSLREDIQQSIREKQKATTAIALTLSQVVSSKWDRSLQEQDILAFETLFQRINLYSDYKNLWIQLVSAEGQSLYRSWSPVRESLKKVRPEFSNFRTSLEPFTSISSGRFDLSLKVVTPIMVKGELVGFLDLISHFNSVQLRMEKKGVDSLVLATPERSALINKPFGQHRLGERYVANLNPNVNLLRSLTPELVTEWIQREDDYILWGNRLVVVYPLKTNSGEVHGHLIAFKSATIQRAGMLQQSELSKQKSILIGLNVALVLFIVLGAALFLTGRQKNYYQNILNAQEEAVFVTNGREMIEANSRLYHYFPKVGKLDTPCVCDFFLAQPGYLQKRMGEESWLSYLLQHPHEEHRVLVQVNGEECVFRISAQALERTDGLSAVALVDISHLVELNAKLQEQSLTDELTGAGNRRYFHRYLDGEMRKLKRYGGSLSVMLFDVDHFKRVNDTHGHHIGDVVLKQIAEIVFDNLRDSDQFFRIGGEEFLIIADKHNLDDIRVMAERIRSRVEKEVFDEVGQVTISAGFAEMRPDETEADLMKRVDDALYFAKAQGRNQIKEAVL